VFAVPGSILTQGSIGTNRLIQDGAKLVTRAADILEELNLSMVAEQTIGRQALPEDETEAALMSQLSAEPTHVDELRQRADLPISQVTSTLALMELKGMVRQVGSMKYVVAREPGVEYIVE
jgi:DNA processing protein